MWIFQYQPIELRLQTWYEHLALSHDRTFGEIATSSVPVIITHITVDQLFDYYSCLSRSCIRACKFVIYFQVCWADYTGKIYATGNAMRQDVFWIVTFATPSILLHSRSLLDWSKQTNKILCCSQMSCYHSCPSTVGLTFWIFHPRKELDREEYWRPWVPINC